MKNYSSRITCFFLALLITVGLSNCGGGDQTTSENNLGIKLPFQETIRPVGAGASFPAPLYKSWFVALLDFGQITM